MLKGISRSRSLVLPLAGSCVKRHRGKQGKNGVKQDHRDQPHGPFLLTCAVLPHMIARPGTWASCLDRYLSGRREGILDAALQALLPKGATLPVAPTVRRATQLMLGALHPECDREDIT